MPIHRVSLPASGGTIWSHTKKHINGSGVGSVLLNKGGAGSASSYLSLEDYIDQTGQHPVVSGKGVSKSLSAVNNQLEKLLVKASKNPTKMKNINFNI